MNFSFSLIFENFRDYYLHHIYASLSQIELQTPHDPSMIPYIFLIVFFEKKKNMLKWMWAVLSSDDRLDKRTGKKT